MTDAKMSRFTVEISKELRRRLEEAVAREDRTITVIVRRAIEEYLTKSEAGHE